MKIPINNNLFNQFSLIILKMIQNIKSINLWNS